MVWTGRRRVVQHRHHQALSPVGETVPSRRHNQTDSESGKEANEADTEEVPVSPSFFGSRDVDVDGQVTISDVTALIDKLLAGA